MENKIIPNDISCWQWNYIFTELVSGDNPRIYPNEITYKAVCFYSMCKTIDVSIYFIFTINVLYQPTVLDNVFYHKNLILYKRSLVALGEFSDALFIHMWAVCLMYEQYIPRGQ